MFPDQGPEPAAPLLADEDVAAVAVGQAAQAVVAAGALVVAKAGRRAVGVRVNALGKRCTLSTHMDDFQPATRNDSWQTRLAG